LQKNPNIFKIGPAVFAPGTQTCATEYKMNWIVMNCNYQFHIPYELFISFVWLSLIGLRVMSLSVLLDYALESKVSPGFMMGTYQ
jgi:hypothetical protein